VLLPKTTQLRYNQIYLGALKKTLKLAQQTCHNDLLRTLGAKDPETIKMETFTRVYLKCKLFQQDTKHLEAHYDIIKDKVK